VITPGSYWIALLSASQSSVLVPLEPFIST
jgi:hypothetical protein